MPTTPAQRSHSFVTKSGQEPRLTENIALPKLTLFENEPTLRLLATFGEAGVAPCQRLSHTRAHDRSRGHQSLSLITAIVMPITRQQLAVPPPVPAGVARAVAHGVGPAGSGG